VDVVKAKGFAVRLDGKVAIVTGAGSGIGLAIARAFVEAGARTALVDTDRKALERSQVDLTPQATLLVAADVTRSEHVARLVGETIAAWGRIDILVNNVGGMIGATGLEIRENDWDATVALCLKSQYLCTKAVAPTMRRQKSGRIVNISSNAGRFRSNTGASSIAYCAAKGGVLQFTRSAAHALGPDNVTVNAIAPGSVFSEAGVREFEALPEPVRDRVMRETALGYFADPGEIASIALFLASDDASYVTGATIIANGGWCTA
jgi:NAD(P)-dependent dehydrogenase (short-subunit alcohol dehydrogenase family)